MPENQQAGCVRRDTKQALKLLRQQRSVYAARHIGHICIRVENIVAVLLKAERTLGEHMPAIVFQMICRDSEHPS